MKTTSRTGGWLVATFSLESMNIVRPGVPESAVRMKPLLGEPLSQDATLGGDIIGHISR